MSHLVSPDNYPTLQFLPSPTSSMIVERDWLLGHRDSWRETQLGMGGSGCLQQTDYFLVPHLA